MHFEALPGGRSVEGGGGGGGVSAPLLSDNGNQRFPGLSNISLCSL